MVRGIWGIWCRILIFYDDTLSTTHDRKLRKNILCLLDHRNRWDIPLLLVVTSVYIDFDKKDGKKYKCVGGHITRRDKFNFVFTISI